MATIDGKSEHGDNVVDFSQYEWLDALGREMVAALRIQSMAGVEAANRWVIKNREKRAERHDRLDERRAERDQSTHSPIDTDP